MLYYIYYDILYIVQIILIISCIIRGSNSNMYRLIIIQYIYIYKVQKKSISVVTP